MISRAAVCTMLFMFAANSATAEDVMMHGTTRLRGSIFYYEIYATGKNARRIEAIHDRPRYEGDLARMSFRSRHLQIFKMVALLMKRTCPSQVTSLGNIKISKDPEMQTDPAAEHPKYFMWEYTCG